MKMSSHSRGTGLIIWSIIFMVLSVVMPGIATVISFFIALGLHKYPERRKAEVILIVLSIIIMAILLMTGSLVQYWSGFITGIKSVH